MVTHLMIVMKDTQVFGAVSESEFNSFIVDWMNYVIKEDEELLSYEEIISYYMLISDSELKIKKLSDFLTIIWLQTNDQQSKNT